MSESESPSPDVGGADRKRIRPRTRVRIRERSEVRKSLGKWWGRRGNSVLIWGGFLVAAIVLIVAAQKGYIRGPSAPSPE